MESRVNYTLVGLFVILLMSGLIAGVFWLSTEDSRLLYTTYIVNMDEPVAGLTKQSSVKYNGVDVGYVHKIRIDQENPQLVHLRLKIQHGIPITENTKASLRAQGLTGLTYISLQTVKPGGLALKTQPGDEHPEIPTEPSFLVRLDTTVRKLSDNLTNLTTNLNLILSDENQKAISASLSNIRDVTDAIARNAAEIDVSIKRTSRIMYNASIASERLPSMSEELEKTLKSMHEMTQSIIETSTEVTSTMRDSRVAIVGISQQVLPSTVITLNRLSNAALSIEQLSQDLKRNPSILVRGKKAPPPGPGE